MFGTYPIIASKIQAANDTSAQNDLIYHEPLPAYLRPNFQPPQFRSQGREKHGLTEDFIMVAEFSELEGPKPLMTVPKDVGENFDQNAFAVWILSVDCQNSAESFSTSEDSQIVMTDIQTGVFAFVHHLLLYDNTARGFVRPYCIAYITAEQRKIMHFYEELSQQFRKVARYLKYGNKMLFVGDLEKHLGDLEYTKNFLLNQVSKIRLRNGEESNLQVKDVRRNAENELYKALHMIQESSIEIKKIIAIFKPLLLNRKLEARFKMLEEKAFHRAAPPEQDRPSLHEGWFNDLSGLEELNTKSNSVNGARKSSLTMFKPREYKPILVKTKKAKRFNAPLRGLHELCSWGAKEGLRKMRHIQEYFKRDMTILELERNETRLFYPFNASISYGQCITGNFLSDVHMNGLNMSGEIEQGGPTLCRPDWNSAGSMESLVSLKSAVSSHSSLSGIDQASPSSDHTLESQSAWMLHASRSSLQKAFSLPSNCEYSSNLNEEITSRKTFTNDDDEDSCESLMPELENYFQEHPSILSGNTNIAEVINHIHRTLNQPDGQVLEGDQHVDLNRTLSICSQIFPADLNFSKDGTETITTSERRKKFQGFLHCVKDAATENEMKIKADVSEVSKTAFVKTNNLNVLLDNSNFKVDNKCTKGLVTERPNRNRYDVPVCDMQQLVCSDNCWQESSTPGGDDDARKHSDASLDDSVALDTQSHAAECKNVKESVATADSSIQDNALKNRLSLVPARKMNPTSHRDNKTLRSTTEDNLESPSKSIGNKEVQSQVKKDESTNLLKPDEDTCLERPSYLSIAEDVITDSETVQASLSSSWMLGNEQVVGRDLSRESEAEKLAVEGISRNSSSSNLSNTLSQRQHHAHHTTEEFSSQNQKICPVEMSHELRCRRVRSESDVSSVYTTCSVDEFYPHEREGPPGTNNFQLHGLSERFEEIDVEDDYVGIQCSVHSGVWKPRCGIYAVGDWINNLTFGRPGHCLFEVLATYQKLEHVIFSLLCGRPVLVVGPAEVEQDVVKLVNALAVFVPGTGRKFSGVIEWTSQCLRITDLAKLKLVGVCRPRRRSADSFIPSAIKRVCSVVDVEKRTISAPTYQGQFISTLLSKRKALKSDTQLLSYIEWWLMDILGKAFLYFHIFCLGPAGSIIYSHSPKDQRDAYCHTVSNILTSLGVRDHDQEIIEHLTELVKMAELEPNVWLDEDPASIVHPLALKNKICEKFRC